MRFRKVTLVGVGLLGGSLGMALRQRGLAEHVCGVVRRSAIIADCERLGAVDLATRNLGPAVRGADLVVLCSPIGQMGPLTQELIPYLEPDAVVTDVGSVKGTLVDELEAPIAKAGGHFIGSHPMAGSEKTGVQAALCAGGFRDTTRIASGSPEMWRDIALANRENLGRVLGVLIEDLQEFQRSLRQGDAKAVTEFFTSAKERRDAWANPSATATAE